MEKPAANKEGVVSRIVPFDVIRRFYDAAWAYRHAVEPEKHVAELDEAGQELGRFLDRTFLPVSERFK